MYVWKLSFLAALPFALYSVEEDCKFYGNPSHSICPCSYAVEAYLEFLYLQPFEEGLTYAIRNDVRQGAGGGDGTPGGPLIDLSPRWQPGFRVAAGYAPDFTAHLIWTYFHASTTNHAACELTLPGIGIQSVWVPAIDTSRLYDSAAFRWNLHFDTLDIELGKRYQVSRYLTMNPVCLARIAWIDQTFDARYGSSDEASAMNDFFGVGPAFAIQTDWGFARGWAISCSSAFALLYGWFSTQYDLSLSSVPAALLLTGVSQDCSKLVPAADFSLGIGYGKCISGGRVYLGGSLSYEAHLYWNQTILMQPLGSDAASLALQGMRNLSIQGFSLRAYVEF